MLLGSSIAIIIVLAFLAATLLVLTPPIPLDLPHDKNAIWLDLSVVTNAAEPAYSYTEHTTELMLAIRQQLRLASRQ